MILVVILALISHVSYALNDMSGAMASRKFDGKAMSLMSWMVGAVLYTVMAPFLITNTFYLWPTVVAGFTGVWFAIAYPIFLKALEKGNATLVGVIAGTFPLWTVVFSLLLYGEKLTSTESVVIGIIMIGIVLSALHLTTKTRLHNLLNKHTFLALIVSLMWGFGFAIIKYPTERIGWFNTSFMNSMLGALTSMIWLYPACRGKVKAIFKKYKAYPIVNSATGTAGTLAYTYALTRGNASLVAPIAGSYSGLFAVLSYLVFKEKLTRIQTLGVLIILGGVISLSVIVSRS